jgi:hypothetical protein
VVLICITDIINMTASVSLRITVIFIISGVNYMYNIFILSDTEAVIFIISVIQMRTTGIN